MSTSKKGNNYFRFKQFIVYQDRCAMKVGTDGVLLGAWTAVRHEDKVLDIGTGTGLIALMLAQKDTSLHICAIDINKDACYQATRNVAESPFSKQITIKHCALEDFNTESSFDLIVSNPPYFQDSLLSPDMARSIARHTQSLSMHTLFNQVAQKLASDGRFCMIYPYADNQTIEQIARDNALRVNKRLIVYTTPNSLPKRMLWEFTRIKACEEAPIQTNEITIEESRHVYSASFIDLVKNYYWKL